MDNIEKHNKQLDNELQYQSILDKRRISNLENKLTPKGKLVVDNDDNGLTGVFTNIKSLKLVAGKVTSIEYLSEDNK